MKMSNCCIPNQSCEYCKLYKLLSSKDIPNNQQNFEAKDCILEVISLYKYLHSLLIRSPSGINDAKAVELISLTAPIMMSVIPANILDLCAVAAQSIITRGLKSNTDQNRAKTLFGWYENLLKQYKNSVDEQTYKNAYLVFLNVKYQINHLSGNYTSIINHFNCIKNSNIIGADVLSQRIIAQVSESMYATHMSIYRLEANEIASGLLKDIQKASFNNTKQPAENYFIMAKYLEHHIYSGTIEEGLDKILPLTPDFKELQKGNIETTIEALNLTILARDLFEAMYKVGSSEQADSYLDFAESTISDFAILDQQGKLDLRKEKLQHYGSNPHSVILDSKEKNRTINNKQLVSVEQTNEDKIDYILNYMEKNEILASELIKALCSQDPKLQQVINQLAKQNASGGIKAKITALRNILKGTVEFGDNIHKLSILLCALYAFIINTLQ